MAALNPPSTTTTPAAMPVTAPLDRTARRESPDPAPAVVPPRLSSQVSTAGAPAAPASSNGVQAKKKTMSEPV